MPQLDSGKAALQPTHLSEESLSSSTLPHDVLVRSLHSIIKCAFSVSFRDNSPYTMPSSSRDVFTSRQGVHTETDWAAEILAISETSGFLTDISFLQVTAFFFHCLYVRKYACIVYIHCLYVRKYAYIVYILYSASGGKCSRSVAYIAYACIV